jgi:hypothetical protein
MGVVKVRDDGIGDRGASMSIAASASVTLRTSRGVSMRHLSKPVSTIHVRPDHGPHSSPSASASWDHRR